MCTLSINNELKGIELVFESKPAQEILTSIKAAGFRWHNLKKLWYAKQTPERMELAEKLAGGNTTESALAVPVPVAEKVNKFGIKVGDVFVESWGYEQTNIDFWQVVELRGTTQIVLRAIASEGRDIGFCSRMVKPVRDNFLVRGHYAGTEIRKTVKGTPENPYCNAEHGLLYKTSWDEEHNETSYY